MHRTNWHSVFASLVVMLHLSVRSACCLHTHYFYRKHITRTVSALSDLCCQIGQSAKDLPPLTTDDLFWMPMAFSVAWLDSSVTRPFHVHSYAGAGSLGDSASASSVIGVLASSSTTSCIAATCSSSVRNTATCCGMVRGSGSSPFTTGWWADTVAAAAWDKMYVHRICSSKQ